MLDIAATLDLNEYNGSTSVSVIIKDVKAHDDNPQALLESKRDFEDFCSGTVTDRRRLRNLLPTREDFALLYRFLRDSNGYVHSADTLPGKLHYRLSYGKIRVMLEAMSETGLVEIREGLKTNRITLRPVSGKVNLENAQILKKLREVIA